MTQSLGNMVACEALREGLAVAHELAILSERPDLVARFATEEEKERSRRMDEYLAGSR